MTNKRAIRFVLAFLSGVLVVYLFCAAADVSVGQGPTRHTGFGIHAAKSLAKQRFIPDTDSEEDWPIDRTRMGGKCERTGKKCETFVGQSLPVLRVLQTVGYEINCVCN